MAVAVDAGAGAIATVAAVAAPVVVAVLAAAAAAVVAGLAAAVVAGLAAGATAVVAVLVPVPVAVVVVAAAGLLLVAAVRVAAVVPPIRRRIRSKSWWHGEDTVGTQGTGRHHVVYHSAYALASSTRKAPASFHRPSHYDCNPYSDTLRHGALFAAALAAVVGTGPGIQDYLFESVG